MDTKTKIMLSLIIIYVTAALIVLIQNDISIKIQFRKYAWMILIPWLVTVITNYRSGDGKIRLKYDHSSNEKRKEKAMNEIEKLRSGRMKREWNNYYRRYPFSFVDNMSDEKFVDLIVRLLRENEEYFDVRKTENEEYHGIDILCLDNKNYRMGVQVLKEEYDIGREAIELIIKGIDHYGCSKGIIAAASNFKYSAIKLAATDPRVELWDRSRVEKLYYDTIPSKIPPFSMDKAEKLGLPYKIRLTRIEKEIIFRKYGLDYYEDYNIT
jgi:hypothetical protein